MNSRLRSIVITPAFAITVQDRPSGARWPA